MKDHVNPSGSQLYRKEHLILFVPISVFYYLTHLSYILFEWDRALSVLLFTSTSWFKRLYIIQQSGLFTPAAWPLLACMHPTLCAYSPFNSTLIKALQEGDLIIYNIPLWWSCSKACIPNEDCYSLNEWYSDFYINYAVTADHTSSSREI